ncbi:hypothetical protein D3C72_1163390 [compost metagenome]
MRLGPQPGGEAVQGVLFECTNRHMKAGHVARALGQGRRGFQAAAVLQVVPDLLFVEIVAQRRHRETVAGVEPHGRVGGIHQLLQFDFQFGRQAVQRGREPRRDALAGPHQLLGHRREGGSPSTCLGDQGAAEQRFGVAQDAPGVAVRQRHGLGRLGDVAGGLDMAKQGHQP